MSSHCPLFDIPIVIACPADNGEPSPPIRFERRLETFGTHNQIFTEGDPVQGVHCLHQGRIALLKRSTFGGNHPVGIATPGDLLGALELVNDTPHNNTGITMEPCSACFIPRDMFRMAIRNDPGIMVRVMHRLCLRINDLEQQGPDLPAPSPC